MTDSTDSVSLVKESLDIDTQWLKVDTFSLQTVSILKNPQPTDITGKSIIKNIIYLLQLMKGDSYQLPGK